MFVSGHVTTCWEDISQGYFFLVLYGDIISAILPQGDPDRGPKSQVDGGLSLLQGPRAGAVPLEHQLATMAGGAVLSSRVSRAVLDIAWPFSRVTFGSGVVSVPATFLACRASMPSGCFLLGSFM